MAVNLPVVLSTTLTEQEEDAVRDFIMRLQTQHGEALRGVILYGSSARGDAAADFDIDLLIIMETDDWPTRDAVSHVASRVSLAFDVLISPHLVSLSRWQTMTRDPFTFYQNVFSEGIPLFGPRQLFASLARKRSKKLT